MDNNIHENNDENMSNLEENIAIDGKFKQMRGLKAYKSLDDKTLRDLAKHKLASPEADLDIASLFTDKKEVTVAKKLLNKYLKDYTPASVSDKNNLRHLIYLEIIQVRLQDKMNAVNATSNAIPLQMIDSIHKNLREINDLKLKLGLIGEKREETKNDAYMALDMLKDKFQRWREENQGTRHLVCPHCGKLVMLKIRTTAWEAQKHPFFADRILTNKHLMSLYAKNKLTKEDVANVLECSTDYVDWLLEKWRNNEDSGAIKAVEGTEASKASGDAESGEVEDMNMSKEKIERENRCPECEGFLSCRVAEDGTGRWEEHCTNSNCEYHKIHVDRRKKQIPVDFPDRRAPSSLQQEETEEHDKQGNSEGGPGHRERTGAERERQTDIQD